MNPSISQKFVESLVEGDFEHIPCECPACQPTRPWHVTDTQEFGCLRLKTLIESMRYHRQLLAASCPKPVSASSEVPPPPEEHP
jgi:hypothetical protein